MAEDRVTAHLIAGGIGGTFGAVVTCPLEVVKTRLQSSVATFNNTATETYNTRIRVQQNVAFTTSTRGSLELQPNSVNRAKPTANLYVCLRYIIHNEGARGLFKGLGPNIVGVAPSRAIYFCAYANSKKFLNSVITPDTPVVHLLAAMCAGVTASTCTNPIWFVKTRLQLDQKRDGGLTTNQCIRQIYQESGIRGFYKGITASYFGVSETMIHFVIYEGIKAKLREQKGTSEYEEQRSMFDFVEFMLAGATSKTIATCVAYPHEVVRTRLRQEGDKYNRFLQTLCLVAKEEGLLGLYRGLVTQLFRQIPNTAIMMATYEAVLHIAHKYW